MKTARFQLIFHLLKLYQLSYDKVNGFIANYESD